MPDKDDKGIFTGDKAKEFLDRLKGGRAFGLGLIHNSDMDHPERIMMYLANPLEMEIPLDYLYETKIVAMPVTIEQAEDIIKDIQKAIDEAKAKPAVVSIDGPQI